MIKSCLSSCLLIFILIIVLVTCLLINSHNEVSKITNPSQYENIAEWLHDMAIYEWKYIIPGLE